MVGKMEEHLLTALLVAPFFITMVGFAVAIAFAPAVPKIRLDARCDRNAAAPRL
jgi:hypothetical protein